MKRFASLVGVVVVGVGLNGCALRMNGGGDSITASEASEALDEASASAQAADLTSASIDVATNFTIGQAAEQAAAELSAFIASQLPCAGVTLAGSTLTVVYGAKLGNCTYNGHTFSGTQTLTITKLGTSSVEVDHTWSSFSNGVVSVSGSAQVTWDFANPSRHVVHDLTWTRLWDGRQGHGTGDRLQTPLAGGIAVGFQEDGSRTWDGTSGHWDLSIDAVQMRWADPVPQAGSYTLTLPNLKTVTMSFSRVDDNTIRVTVSTTKSSFGFNVTRTGQTS